MTYVFLTACRNEAGILEEFLSEFYAMVKQAGIAGNTALYVVDDFSVDRSVEILEQHRVVATDQVRLEIIRAPMNLGNQGALFYGLSRLEISPADVLVTFDSDGEDDVGQIPSLLALGRENLRRLVLVERGRRRESLAFRVSFTCYKALFRFLTRHSVIPNNFMLIPGEYVPAIRRLPLAPAHFAYAVLKLGLPSVQTQRDRRARYGGTSSQNLFTVASHGLVGLMVFYENVVARLLVLLLFFGLVGTAVVGFALGIRESSPVQRALLWGAVASAGVVASLVGLMLSAGLALLLKLVVYHVGDARLPRQSPVE